MPSCYRAIVDSEIWICHHFHRKTSALYFVMNLFGEININIHVVVIPKQVWKLGQQKDSEIINPRKWDQQQFASVGMAMTIASCQHPSMTL